MQVLSLLTLTCPWLLSFPTLAALRCKRYIKRHPNSSGEAKIKVINRKCKFKRSHYVL